MDKIKINNQEISITGLGDDYYISLTDIAKFKNPDEPKIVVANWMRLRGTIEFLGIWETINNQYFKRIEFDTFKNNCGENSFVLTPTKWIEKTCAIGIKTRRGRYSEGTLAHRDIALEFASWISPELRLYIIKEFQRLKIKENNELEWKGERFRTKLNYLIQTDAIKKYLVPVQLTEEQKSYIYASEADLLNVALFGMKASDWRNSNPNKNGNIRDYASLVELTLLCNLELLNSEFIKLQIPQKERLILLNAKANEEKEIYNKNNLKQIDKKK